MWIIKDRSGRFSVSETKLTTLAEILYSVIMLYTLVNEKSSFLIIAALSLVVHAALGLCVEIFKPEQKIKESIRSGILEKFWSFLLIDTVVTLGCFLLMIDISL
jgi:lipoprotein signal peptidase